MHTGPCPLVGHEACFHRLELVCLGLLCRAVCLRLMLLQHGLHACLVELQRLPLIGLAQAFDQGVQLQARHLGAQALAQAGAQAVSQVVVVRVGQGKGRHQAQT
jgi:hypothetical protein